MLSVLRSMAVAATNDTFSMVAAAGRSPSFLDSPVIGLAALAIMEER